MEAVGLPQADDEQRQISSRLSAQLAELIRANGPMPFAEYMHRCLYEPGLGYYVNGLSKIGAAGDFTTAPEISADLAGCVATQAVEVLTEIGGGQMLEFGGGTGRFAVDILRAMHQVGCVPDQYLILDVSPDLQQQQQQYVREALPATLADRVQWVDSFVQGFRGVAVANELFDAFPVERFSVMDGVAHQVCIDVDGHGLHEAEIDNADIARHVQQLLTQTATGLPDYYRSEFCPVMRPWWNSLSEAFDTGVVIVLDYGCERSRYYSPLRANGSTRCYFRHTLHSDVLIHQGVQDITADVDFTALAEAAVANQFALEGYTTMTQFMLSLGAIDNHQEIVAELAEKDRIEATGKLKQVLLPEEMGERFMVAGFSRNIDPVLRGFSVGDQSRLL